MMNSRCLPHSHIAKTKLARAISISLFPLLMGSSLAVHSQESLEEQEESVSVASSQAQNTTEVGPQTMEDTVEVIEVSGFRSSATEQLNYKRFSKNVSDSIFAEDMGKMPDANIAEAMSRITGIGIDRVDGEGTEITIRGVEGSLNNVQMNGVTLTNSGDDNSVDFSSMSADMLRSIEVIKSPSANHDEGSLGGTVKLSTWKPLDIKKKRTVITAKGIYNDLSEEFNPTLGISFGNNFSDNFGVTASANWSKNTTRQDRLTNYRWQFRNAQTAISSETGEVLDPVDPDGSFYRVFDAFGYEKNYSTVETENLSLATSIQYKFNDDASVWLDVTHSDRKKTKFQYNQTITNLFTGAGVNIVDEDAGTSVAIDGPASRARIVAFEQPNETTTDTLGLNYQHLLFDGAWTLDAMFGYSRSTSHFPLSDSRRAIFNSGAAGAQPATIDWFDDNGKRLLAPEYTVDDSEDGTFPSESIPIQSLQYLLRDSEDETFTYQLDLQGDVEFGPIVGIAMGVKFVSRDRSANALSLFTNLETTTATIDGAEVALEDITLADFSADFPANDYLTRVLGTQSNGWTIPDYTAIYDLFLPNALAGVNVDGDAFTALIDDDEANVTTFDSKAIYLMANYELFEGKLLGDFGIRLVNTDSFTSARAGFRFTAWDPEGAVLQDENGEDVLDENGDPVLTGAFNDGNFDITNSVYGGSNYNNALPSFNARYMISEEMLLRFSVGKVMSRPKPSYLVPGYLVTARNGNEPSATGGNPDLQPTKVTQYDLSWEWYFDSTSMVSVAGFYKDFETLTYERTVSRGYSDEECSPVEAFPEEQQQYRDLHCEQILSDVATTTQANGAGGKILGIETSYQQDFTFLPGWAQYFGTVLNYTYADSEATFVDAEDEESAATAELLDGFPMQNTSKHTFNGTLYWENEDFSARIAYNFRSKRLTDPSSFDGAIWTDDRTTVDFSARYNVSKALSITFAATNLTDTYNRQFITRLEEEPENGLYSEGNALDGNAPEWRTYILDHNGRNFRLGATYKF